MPVCHVPMTKEQAACAQRVVVKCEDAFGNLLGTSEMDIDDAPWKVQRWTVDEWCPTRASKLGTARRRGAKHTHTASGVAADACGSVPAAASLRR